MTTANDATGSADAADLIAANSRNGHIKLQDVIDGKISPDDALVVWQGIAKIEQIDSTDGKYRVYYWDDRLQGNDYTDCDADAEFRLLPKPEVLTALVAENERLTRDLNALRSFAERVEGAFNPMRFDDDHDRIKVMNVLFGLSKEAYDLLEALEKPESKNRATR